jgi:hypothetical protein
MGDNLFESIVDPVLGVTRPSDFHGETVGYHHAANKLRSVKPTFEPYVTAGPRAEEKQSASKMMSIDANWYIIGMLAIMLVLIIIAFVFTYKLNNRIWDLELRALVEDIRTS